MRNLPEVFPEAVPVHALSRPFLPATPRRTVDSYWRYHPIRADKLARALAALTRAPEGWGGESESRNRGHWLVFGYHQPHFANRPIRRAPAIAVCAGSPYFGSAGIATFGGPAPKSERYMAQLLRCGLELMDCAERSCPAPEGSSEAPLSRNRRTTFKNAEADHHVPLFKVWHDYRDRPWPALLAFWGVPNLQVINRSAHVEKCA